MKRGGYLGLLVALLYVLHQDFWNWNRVEPMVLGFMPIGLAYHALFSVMVSLLMVLLVRYAWPRHLETHEEAEHGRGDEEGPR